MSRRKKSRSRAGAQGAATPSPAPPVAAPPSGRKSWLSTLVIVGALALAAGAAWWLLLDKVSTPSPTQPAAAHYVGAKTCAECHARQYDEWKVSHHALAMQVADDKTVLGDFANAGIRYAGITSTFFKRNGRFFVNTDGPGGRLSDFEIKYTFGITPLQQYLVEFPDGRLQALSIAWDSRPKGEGGQRWFHLYPEERITHGDALHWTKLQQNWNYMCADCHSTNLRKNYDESANTFKTSWSEINVACEACHGPGSNHVAWAKKEGDWKRVDARGRGFAVAYDERRGVTWTVDAASGNAVRSRPRETAKEIETCARCHARRGQISEDYAPGRPIGDGYRISLLEDGLYWPDGQMRDEVYNVGSLVQSRMYAKGVTCSDCHDPHSARLRAPGNAVCAQCHLPAKYDAPGHHHHAAGSKGAECTACHMPTTTYMVVDPRHDHSFRVPRPDLSAALGTPNACNDCHTGRKPQWAAATIEKWKGRAAGGFQSVGEAFSAWSRHSADARGRLIRIADDAAQPAIVRASALERLAADPTPFVVELAVRAMNDRDPLVRRAAVGVITAAGPEARARYLPRMLEDPIRAVRVDAARALAAIPPQQIAPEYRVALPRAVDEYIAVERYNSDRPESHLNLGALHAERGEFDQAEAQYRQALKLSPGAVSPIVNLADLYRARGEEIQAEKLLRDAVKSNPRAAALHYALGLALVRQGRQKDALPELAAAARLAPGAPRYAYVYGIALHSLGEKARGIATLEQAHQKFPGDRAILQALATMERDRGNPANALGYAEQLAAIAPDDRDAQALLRQLRR